MAETDTKSRWTIIGSGKWLSLINGQKLTNITRFFSPLLQLQLSHLRAKLIDIPLCHSYLSGIISEVNGSTGHKGPWTGNEWTLVTGDNLFNDNAELCEQDHIGTGLVGHLLDKMLELPHTNHLAAAMVKVTVIPWAPDMPPTARASAKWRGQGHIVQTKSAAESQHQQETNTLVQWDATFEVRWKDCKWEGLLLVLKGGCSDHIYMHLVSQRQISENDGNSWWWCISWTNDPSHLHCCMLNANPWQYPVWEMC